MLEIDIEEIILALLQSIAGKEFILQTANLVNGNVESLFFGSTNPAFQITNRLTLARVLCFNGFSEVRVNLAGFFSNAFKYAFKLS